MAYIGMSDLAQMSPPRDQIVCEKNEALWGFRLTGGPGEGWRVVDLVPLAGAFIGALPGLIYRRSTPGGAATALAVLGGGVGLVAGWIAWLILPPHGRPVGFMSFTTERQADKEAMCSGGILG